MWRMRRRPQRASRKSHTFVRRKIGSSRMFPPSTTGSKLCGYMANYTRSEFWQPNAVYPCSGSGGVCNGSGNSFGTAEAIQYTAFNTFKVLYTQAFDLPEYGNYSTGLGAYGNDPFTTTMFQIGSSSHLIGGSCIGLAPQTL